MESLALMLSASVNAGTILALAALGLLVNERAGVVNLGRRRDDAGRRSRGLRDRAASSERCVAFAAGAGAGAFLAALFGLLVIGLGTNQYATGLALTLVRHRLHRVRRRGPGRSAAARSAASGAGVHPGAGALPDLPAFPSATALFSAITRWSTWRRRWRWGWPGFSFARAPGWSCAPSVNRRESAHALGLPVRRVRFAAVVFGGALCGLAGAYVSIVYAHLWVEGLTAGKGWIALALTTFATWRPARVLLGAYLFGGVTMLQFHLQGRGVDIESHLLGMSPYVATILVLVLISRNRAWVRVNMPASLGKAFRPDN